MSACPLERRFEAFLIERGIKFTRPERDTSDPTNLDYFLPGFRTYVEIKQFHTERIAEQLSHVKKPNGCIVLLGEMGLNAFLELAKGSG